MPKSVKKKKEKAADFSKAKLKLGKGKQTPSNAVDTTFKARSIALPSQSITHSSDAAVPITKRRLTFEDLLAHLKHYNPGTRRDALFGLKELFEDHPELILSSLAPLLNGCVRVVGDEDASVRKALLTFLSWLFPRIIAEDLSPHAPVLLLFTTSAQTHIFPEIRIDAVRVLDLLLQYIPSVVVEGWARSSGGHGRRVLEGYLGILSAGTAFGEGGDNGPVQATSTSSVVLSPGSKLVVLKSLSSFLSTAVSSHSTGRPDGTLFSQPTPSWFFSSSFSSDTAFEAFDSLIGPTIFGSSRTDYKNARLSNELFGAENNEDDFICNTKWAVERVDDHIGLDDLVNVEQTLDDAESSSGTTVESAYIAQIARTLHPTLISVFLDCAPTVFAPGSVPPEIDLQLILSVVDIACVLYGSLARSTPKISRDGFSLYDGVNAFLGHMSAYFPFTLHWPNSAKRDIKVEEAFQSLNLAFCELSSLLILRNSHERQDNLHLIGKDTTLSSGKRALSKSERLKPLFMDRVQGYVMGALRGEVSVTSSVQPLLQRSITPSAYIALLPTIWALICSRESDLHGDLLAAVVDHSVRVSPTSALKRHTVEFIGRMILLGTVPGASKVPGVLQQPEVQKKLQEWLLHLPRSLWELNSKDPLTTEIILRLLLRLSQRRSSVFRETAVSSVQSRLVPYFVICHNTRGKLPGPYKKLPPPLRTLALDVIFTLSSLAKHDELDGAVHDAALELGEDYWASLRGDVVHSEDAVDVDMS